MGKVQPSAAYDDDYVEVDMAQKEPTRQESIIIERRERIGEIQASPLGNVPMVVAAFEMAGTYLNEKASKGEVGIEVTFEFEGVTFRAACDAD